MAKVPVKLVHEPVFSTQTAERYPPGQAHWWLRGDSDFVRLPRRVRGDEALDMVVHLEPGRYTLGIGPVRAGVREEIVVEAAAAPAAKKVEKPPAFAKGSLVVEGKAFVITGDLDAMDRDAAKAWLEGLGAKVTTSVSSRTDYLLVGHEPGAKKLEKAAELGTRVISEAELRAELGLGEAAAPQVAKPAPPSRAKQVGDAPAGASASELLARFIAKCELGKLDMSKIDKLVGPSHFADLGLHEHELWGIALGPRGGQYSVYIDLKDRPRYAMQCNCREWRPCKHAYALLVTAQRHFVPPAPPPAGHEENARYRPGFE
jgi:BRCA1-like protein